MGDRAGFDIVLEDALLDNFLELLRHGLSPDPVRSQALPGALDDGPPSLIVPH